MKRVGKGETYYCISVDMNAIIINTTIDDKEPLDDWTYDSGNYFATYEEAKIMAEKIRKVLKGAAVIEMPSVEDEFNSIDRIYHQKGYAEGEYCHKQSFSWGFQEGVDWLKSKNREVIWKYKYI